MNCRRLQGECSNRNVIARASDDVKRKSFHLSPRDSFEQLTAAHQLISSKVQKKYEQEEYLKLAYEQPNSVYYPHSSKLILIIFILFSIWL